MLEQILQDISRKYNELHDQSNSFEYLFRVVINDSTTRSLLKPKDVHQIIDKLNLTTEKIFIESAVKGNINSIKFILELTPHKNIMDYLKSYNYFNSFIAAARNGHVEFMKYLVELTQESQTLDKMIHAMDDKAFKEAAYNGYTESLKYLLSLEKGTEARSTMIHAEDDFAFRSAASTGKIDTVKFLLSLEEGPDARSKMIHAEDDFTFRWAAENGHIEILKYLISFEEDPEARSKMIHACDEFAFRWASYNGHIETLKYLISLEDNIEARSNMIHAMNDYPYRAAARTSHKETIKYLIVSDPFYEWPNLDIKDLNYYKNIDIKSLCKISTLCKYLFSNSGRVTKNNEDNISILDLPTEILNMILQNLAQVNGEHINQIKMESVIKAFTYESSNYFDSFKGFTYRYESALAELCPIGNSESNSD